MEDVNKTVQILQGFTSVHVKVDTRNIGMTSGNV